MAKKNKKMSDSSVNFITVEAYKIARMNIALSVAKKGCKKIIITSALAHVGKTTTSCNIAAVFSKQINSRVLLIDCDLRKPDVAKFFKIKNTPGLTNYLSGMAELNEIIQKVPNTNLSVICGGVISPNPSELLTSDRFFELLEMLEEDYDYIIIDTPPINVVADALALISHADGVVLVAYEKRSDRNEIDKAVENLKRFNAKILGFILNGSRLYEKRYGKYSYKYKYYR